MPRECWMPGYGPGMVVTGVGEERNGNADSDRVARLESALRVMTLARNFWRRTAGEAEVVIDELTKEAMANRG